MSMEREYKHLEATDVEAFGLVKEFVEGGGTVNVPLFQRKFKLVYNRACRIMAELRVQGLVPDHGPVPGGLAKAPTLPSQFPLVVVVSANGDRQVVGRDVQVEFVLDKERAIRVALDADVLSVQEVRTGELVLLPRASKDVIISSELP